MQHDIHIDAECGIVGGGLAGSLLAIKLARAGLEVVLVEKERAAHHKVCGEFLSSEAIGYLRDAGLHLPSLGAVPVDGVRFAGKHFLVEHRLPFEAWSLSRYRLDETLLQQAAACGARVLRGARVDRIERHSSNWRVQAGEGLLLRCKDAFLASGKHDLQGWLREGGRQNDLVAFKMHWRLQEAEAASLDRYVELFLFHGGYGGLEPVEAGVANLCVVLRRQSLRNLGARWNNLLQSMFEGCSHLRQRLAGATPLWDRPLALSQIPYGRVQRASDGLWRLGDQAAVIPSFTGDGMSIALHSAAKAARMYLAGHGAEEFQSTLGRELTWRVRGATLLSQLLVLAWGQQAASAALQMSPSVLGKIGDWTRIPDRLLESHAG